MCKNKDNRKKSIIIKVFTLVFILSFPSLITAAEPKHQLLINPLALAGKNITPEFEIAFNEVIGLGLRANLAVNWELKGGKKEEDVNDDYDWIYKVNGYGGGLSLRFYPWQTAPNGFYLGPRTDFISFSGTYEDRAHNEEPVDSNLMLYTAHLELGFKYTISDIFVFGLFADFGYVGTQAQDASALLALMYIAGGGIHIGVAF